MSPFQKLSRLSPRKNQSSRAETKRHWQQFYGVDPERLPRTAGVLAARFAPDLAAYFQEEGLPNRLLELGPGLGDSARLFAASGVGVYAFDLVPEGMKAGGLYVLPGVVPILGNLKETLPFSAAAFGACHSRLVLSCDFSREEVTFCVQEMKRVVAPRGLILISVRSTEDPTYCGLGEPGAGPLQCGGVGLHFFSRRSIRSLLGVLEILDVSSDGGCLHVVSRSPSAEIAP